MWIQGIAAVGKEKKKKKPDDQAAQSLEAWLSLPFADLVSACAGAGLPTTGTLEVLADRLHCYYRDVASHQAIEVPPPGFTSSLSALIIIYRHLSSSIVIYRHLSSIIVIYRPTKGDDK